MASPGLILATCPRLDSSTKLDSHVVVRTKLKCESALLPKFKRRQITVYTPVKTIIKLDAMLCVHPLSGEDVFFVGLNESLSNCDMEVRNNGSPSDEQAGNEGHLARVGPTLSVCVAALSLSPSLRLEESQRERRRYLT